MKRHAFFLVRQPGLEFVTDEVFEHPPKLFRALIDMGDVVEDVGHSAVEQIKFCRLNGFPFLGAGPRGQLMAKKRVLKKSSIVGEISDQSLLNCSTWLRLAPGNPRD